MSTPVSLYSRLSVSERKTIAPAVAVSTVAFALHPPFEARIGDPATSETDTAGQRDGAAALAGSHARATQTVRSSAMLWIPLVRRTRAPFAGVWALPGGPIPWNETLVETATRTLRAAAHRDPGYLEQLYSFGAVERSAAAQRLVTIAYWAQYGEMDLASAPEPATPPDENVAWFAADQLPQLAFDHERIIAHALERLRSKTEYSSVAHRFLGESFTLAQLREVHEAILGQSVDPANFRRQLLSQGNLMDTGEMQTGTAHRPAKLYRFRAHHTITTEGSDFE